MNEEPREREHVNVKLPPLNTPLSELTPAEVYEFLAMTPIKPDYLDCERF